MTRLSRFTLAAIERARAARDAWMANHDVERNEALYNAAFAELEVLLIHLEQDVADRRSGYVADFAARHGADALAATAVAFGAACSGQDAGEEG